MLPLGFIEGRTVLLLFEILFPKIIEPEYICPLLRLLNLHGHFLGNTCSQDPI
jgi:hypothetical protein